MSDLAEVTPVVRIFDHWDRKEATRALRAASTVLQDLIDRIDQRHDVSIEEIRGQLDLARRDVVTGEGYIELAL